MNKEHLKEIQERAEKATPGPWTVRANFAVEDGESDAVEVFDSVGVAIVDMVGWQKWKLDADFIAHARAHWLAVYSLVRHRKRARKRLIPLVEANELTALMVRHIATQRESRDALAFRWAITASIWRCGALPSPGLIKGLMATYPVARGRHADLP